MIQIPILEGGQITLRPIKFIDLIGFIELSYDKDFAEAFANKTAENDFENLKFVHGNKDLIEKNKLYYWTVTLKEGDFIGFVRLHSYDSDYFENSFELGHEKNVFYNILTNIDRKNAWEIDFALLPRYRNKNIMTTVVGMVLEYIYKIAEYTIYARIKNMHQEKASSKILERYSFKPLMPLQDLHNMVLGMLFVKHCE